MIRGGRKARGNKATKKYHDSVKYDVTEEEGEKEVEEETH